MKRNKVVYKEPQARVITDSRDGRLDYFIPLERAKVLYNEGKLHMDLTNGCYTSQIKWEDIKSMTPGPIIL